MALSAQKIYGEIFKIWRQRRYVLFREKMQPSPSDTLLDVGGYPAFWLSATQLVRRIDTLNLHPVTFLADEHPQHHIHTLVGNGCALEFGDGSYEIGFSNSVIEHLSTWQNQQRFADEIRRVGRAVWVQTPAYECPFEPHFLAPFIHYLPKAVQKRVVRHFTLWGILDRPNQEQIEEMVDTTRLLTKREMQKLFPDCEIITERIFGFIPKSYIAVRARNLE